MIFRFTAEQKIKNPRWKVFMIFFLHTWVLCESEMVKKPLMLSDCSQPWYVCGISLGCVQPPFVAANQLSPNVFKEILYMEVKEAQQKEKACPGLWSVGDVYPMAFVSSWNPESAIKDSSIRNDGLWIELLGINVWACFGVDAFGQLRNILHMQIWLISPKCSQSRLRFRKRWRFPCKKYIFCV